PVKRYSSGMYVRLAFAVAAHLDPEILIVDEVLAVGDAEFQKKCLGKMKEVSCEGRTVLFVSHNIQAIRFLCTKALLLQKGKILLNSNDVEKCTKFYLLDSYGNNNENNSEFLKAIKGNVPQIVKVKVNTSEDKQIQINGKKMSVDFWLYTPQGLPSASLSFIIKDEYGNNIVHLWLLNSEKPICTKKGITHVRCVIENIRLYMGRYSIDVFFGCALSKLLYDVVEGVCLFEVIMDRYREYEWQPNTCKYVEDCYWELCKEECA
ncbi:MAG: Wzt carbohydrate-binding domain-containing protein, partial [Candidatus Aenigmatarchaeota archaeon]